jgi:tripartite-type tricarboxylate transporter receptor subunit TctC
MFDAIPSSIGHIKSGSLRALGVTTAVRSEALADVPSISDFVPGYEASGWNGIGAPRSTPADIVNKLNATINAALTNPSLRVRLAELGGLPLLGSSAAFGKLIIAETEKWAKVIRTANIKAE